MASTTGWNSSTDTGAIGNDQSSNNSSGFNAFPVGARYTGNGLFVNEGNNAVFWKSTDGGTGSLNRDLSYNDSDLNIGNSIEQDGFSVRFVRD